MTAEAIHKQKKLKKSQHILDHMGTNELATNLFCSTQAEEKLRRDQVQGKDAANAVLWGYFAYLREKLRFTPPVDSRDGDRGVWETR